MDGTVRAAPGTTALRAVSAAGGVRTTLLPEVCRSPIRDRSYRTWCAPQLSYSISVYHALGHNGRQMVTNLPKTGLELGGFKDTTLNY